MPTVGWILEDSVERFLESTTEIPDPSGSLEPSFRCPFCPEFFADSNILAEHLGATHAGERPTLLYNGAEPSSQDTLRTAATTQGVAFHNCTSIVVSANGLPSKLCSHDEAIAEIRNASGRVLITLRNQFEPAAAPISQQYDLEFRIPLRCELELADRTFVSCLAREDPRVADVDAFLQRASYGGASEYVSALADYVLGVLLKDADPSSGIRASARDYRPKLNNALRVLQAFNRPLARLICAFIKFSSNAFPYEPPITGYTELDKASVLLNDLAGAPADETSPTISKRRKAGALRLAVCPIDNGTMEVLRRATQAVDTVRWTAQVDDEFRAEARLASLDPLDRVKLFAIWAHGAIRAGKQHSAIEPLRELVGNDCFGPWAVAALEEYDS